MRGRTTQVITTEVIMKLLHMCLRALHWFISLSIACVGQAGAQSPDHVRAARRSWRIARGAGVVLLGICIFGPFMSGTVTAQDANWTVHPGLTDKWALDLGLYSPKVKTSGSLNNATLGTGTSISFEDDLGLADRDTMGAFLGRVRLGQRWRIEAEYFGLERSGSRAINKTINWGSNTYNVGTVVTTEFSSDIYRVSGGYSFIKDTQRECGVALGLHVTDFAVSLGATGVGVKAGDVTAPLPTVGAYGAYAFTPKWLLSGRMDYFSLKIDEYDGSLVNFTAGIDYRFHRNFGVGVGYRYVDYELEATKASFTGNLTYKFNGPVFYVTGSF